MNEIECRKTTHTFLGNDLWGEVRLAAADAWSTEADLLHVGSTLHLLTKGWVVSAEDLGDAEI